MQGGLGRARFRLSAVDPLVALLDRMPEEGSVPARGHAPIRVAPDTPTVLDAVGVPAPSEVPAGVRHGHRSVSEKLRIHRSGRFHSSTTVNTSFSVATIASGTASRATSSFSGMLLCGTRMVRIPAC